MINVTVSKEFLMIQQFIEEKCGIAIGEEKAYLLESKLVKLLAESPFESFEELYHKICTVKDSETISTVIDAITTNETFWFRDKSPWYIIEDLLLPVYINELRESKRSKVRIWSAACSYGQEPYSIAMCIDNYLKRNCIEDINMNHFEIIATDISHSALQMAEVGRYDSISISRGLDEDYKYKYFKNEGRIWKLDDEIRRKIHFQHFNLAGDIFNFGQFDIIFCRNVLIYFSERFKKEVYKKISQSLKYNGILFIGSSELLEDNYQFFSREQYLNGVFFRKKE